MELPGVSASSDVYIDYANHVVGAAAAWGEAEIISAAQKVVVKEVGDLIATGTAAIQASASATEKADRAVSVARARYGVRDLILGLRVMGVSDALLNGPAGRSRGAVVYKQVFRNDQPSDITGSRIRKEPDLVEMLLARYEAVEAFDGKDAAGQLLADALTASKAARATLVDAEMARSKAADAEGTTRIALRIQLEQAYGKLRAAFPGKREFVESFFPKRERTEKKKAAPAEAPKPAAETPKASAEAPKPAAEAPKPSAEAPKSSAEAAKAGAEAPKSTAAPKAAVEAPKSTAAPKAVVEAPRAAIEAPQGG